MLADGEHAAQAAHQSAARQAVDHDGGPDVGHRHQGMAHDHLPQASQGAGSTDGIGVGGKAHARRQGTGDQAHGQALDHKGQGDQRIGGTHILHDLDLTPTGKHTQADGAAHGDDADDHQHQYNEPPALGDRLLHFHEHVGHLHRSSHAVHARDGLHLFAHGSHLAQVRNGDPVVCLKGVVGLKFVPQGGIVLHIAPVDVQHVLFGHILHPTDPRHGGELFSHLGGGGVVAVRVQVHHGLVLAAQIADHAVHVHLCQTGKAVQGHADTQGRNAGNGHGPVLAQIAQAAPGQKEKGRDPHTVAASFSFVSSFCSSGSSSTGSVRFFQAFSSAERAAMASGSAGISEMMRPFFRVTTR